LGTDREEVVEYYLDSIEWEQHLISLKANYQVLNDIYIFGEYEYRTVSGNMEKYTPAYYHGTTNTFSIGINYGF
jgi:hypothetical protein